MNGKRIFAMFLVLVLVFALVGCAKTDTEVKAAQETTAASGKNDPQTTSPQEPEGNTPIKSSKDTMVIGRTVDIVTMNPYEGGGGDQGWVQELFLESLFVTGQDGLPQPWLCENVVIADDAMSMTFDIRKGVKFHNGAELTIDDYLFSLDLFSKSRQKSSLNYVDFENIKALDDTTVYIPFNEPCGYPLVNMIRIYIFNKEWMIANEGNYSDQMIGTGPYKLVEYVENDSLTTVRFDDYWGQKGYLKNIICRIISEPSVLMIELETGGIDFAMTAPASDIEKALNNPDGKIAAYLSPEFRGSIMWLNCAEGPTTDLRVRQALNYAVDKEAFIKGGFEGIGAVLNTYVPRDAPGHDKELNDNPVYEYNPEKAKALLAEAGYPDGITLEAVSYPQMQTCFEHLKNMLKASNIDINIHIYELAIYGPIVRSTEGWDLFVAQQGMDCEAGPVLSLQTHANNSAPGVREISHYYEIPEAWEYSELLDKAKVTLDINERMKIYSEAQKIFVDNAFTVPLRSYGDIYLYNSSIKGFYKNGNKSVWSWCYFE